MRHFHLGYLFAGIGLTIAVILASLLLFPAWTSSTRSLVVLAVAATGSTISFIAAARRAFEVSPSKSDGESQSIHASKSVLREIEQSLSGDGYQSVKAEDSEMEKIKQTKT